jgi:putative redox protein
MPHIIEVKYTPGLRTQAVHLQSGTTLITDAPTDNNGKGESFSPTDLVCSALCSCLMTIMGIKAEKEGIDLAGMNARVTKIMSANPRKISEIHVQVSHPEIKATPEQREALKHAALTCPVALSLSSSIKQEISFDF